MASLVLGAVGAGIGYSIAGPTGAQWGWAIGSFAGGSLTSLPEMNGARLSDLKVQASTYGVMIPIYFGMARGSGNVIWSSDLIETETSVDAGGKGAPSQSVNTFSYSVDCAVMVCKGPITGIRRIWANGTLILDASSTNTGITGQSDKIMIYDGSETQTPNSLMESYLGSGNVPAHRGTAYVVFEGFQLEKYGNRIPDFTFEVVSDGAFSSAANVPIDDITAYDSDSYSANLYHHPLQNGVVLLRVDSSTTTDIATVHVVDYISGTTRIVQLGRTVAEMRGSHMTYVPTRREIWISANTIIGLTTLIAVCIDVDSYAVTREVIVNTSAFGGTAAGKISYDEDTNSVMFLTDTSTISDTVNLIDVDTLAVFSSGGILTGFVDWWTGGIAQGKHVLAVGNDYVTTGVGFFKSGQIIGNIATLTNPSRIGYDSLRERFFWKHDSTSTSITWRVVSESDLSYTDITVSVEADVVVRDFRYFEESDKIMVVGESQYPPTLALKSYFSEFNASTFEFVQKWEASSSPEVHFNVVELPLVPEYVGTIASYTGNVDVSRFPITQRLADNSVLLSEIVTAICALVGLSSGDIDVTALTDTVDGYVISRQMSARNAIESLQAAYFFDAVESD